MGHRCLSMSIDDPLRETTRDLRRTSYLASVLDLASADVRAALLSEHDPQRALLGVLHSHLGRAWDEGAGREADLRSALSTAQALIDRLRSQLREGLRRRSRER